MRGADRCYLCDSLHNLVDVWVGTRGKVPACRRCLKRHGLKEVKPPEVEA